MKEEQLEVAAKDMEAVEEGVEDTVGGGNTEVDVEHEDVKNEGVVQDDQTQEDIEEQHKAATKLQAIQRGKHARKDFIEKQKQRKESQEGPKPVPSPPKQKKSPRKGKSPRQKKAPPVPKKT